MCLQMVQVEKVATGIVYSYLYTIEGIYRHMRNSVIHPILRGMLGYIDD
jgi:hypothetical protein